MQVLLKNRRGERPLAFIKLLVIILIVGENELECFLFIG